MKQITINNGWTRTIGDKPSRISFSQSQSSQVNLPDDFIITMERDKDTKSGASTGFFPGGRVTYSKSISVPEAWAGKCVLLDIDGAYEQAEVTFNGEPMGIHPYGYTPWQLELDDVILPGEDNDIEIVTRCFQPNSRWYSGGGLYRQVSFWVGAACHIRPWDLFLTTPKAKEDVSTLQMQAVITNTSKQETSGMLTLSCHGANTCVNVQVKAQSTSQVTVSLEVPNTKLWSAEAPNLYDVSIILDTNLGLDECKETVGFRTFAIDAKQGMRVNGTSIKLLGGCIHHDNTMLGAAAYPAAEERKLRILKDAGYNAVRCAHNPPSKTFLDACDRIGMYVMDEAFDCWKIGKNDLDYHLYYEQWWKRDIASMVQRDRNHACIFCWSIGNEIEETGGKGHGDKITQEMADYVRSLDTSRMVTCALHSMVVSRREAGKPARTPFMMETADKMNTAKTKADEPSAKDAAKEKEAAKQAMEARMRQMMADPNALEHALSRVQTNNMGDGYIGDEDVWGALTEKTCEALDMVGYNYFYTRYEKDSRKYPNRIICATETRVEDTYEYYQHMMAHNNVIGDFIWTAYDNLGEAGSGRVMHHVTDLMTGMLGSWPWLSCYQGDMDLSGDRRPQSYFRKIMWGMDSGIHVFAKAPEYAHNKALGLGWQWNNVFASWTWGDENIGKEIYVEAYADCDEVEFLVNDVSQGHCPVKKLKASMILTYQPGTLKAIAYKNGMPIAEDVLTTAGAPVAIQLISDEKAHNWIDDTSNHVLCADGMDLAFLQAVVVDAVGNIVPTNEITLQATVTGGSLAGFGSGNPCTEENYGTCCRKTWGGKTLLSVCSEEAGDITVTVTGEGLSSGEITIPASAPAFPC